MNILLQPELFSLSLSTRKFLTLVTSLLPFSPFPSGPFATRPGLESIGCLADPTSTTLETLVACFDKYTVPQQYYTQLTYDASQPNPEERAAWSDVVTSILSVTSNSSTVDCSSLTMPPALQGTYSFSAFKESVDEGVEYCILSETTALDGVYARGWGLVAVPTSHTVIGRRNIHIAAPHPVYERNTVSQATVIFKRTGARSLLIPGRVQIAYLESTDCIISAPGSQPYYKTDVTHDKNQPFFDASNAILTWQNKNGGCSSLTCAFIHFHGKGASTCNADNIFMSSGLGSSASSVAWYTDSIDRPIKRLQAQLRHTFPTWSISLPSDSTCVLTATKDVVGRLVNQVNEDAVCSEGATARTVTGAFVHLEQDILARNVESLEGWVSAVSNTFEVV